MDTNLIYSISFYSIQFPLLVFFLPLAISATSNHNNFLHCLNSNKNSIPTFTPNTSNYTSTLQSTIQNLRFISPTTPKPNLIIRPLYESHVQIAVICSQKHKMQLKIRSGGHDYDGLSYISDVPYIILDLFNLRKISMDTKENTAWVQSGALIGELYYNIGVKSRNLAFPAGICPTVGVGGHFSGGGYGALLRKFGLAADHILDARIIDANGKILNRESMGEDLFWAIRGGGGGSFGVILSWKTRLVPVPSTVTVFTITKTLEQGATSLVHKWQEVAPKLPKNLFIRVILDVVRYNQTGKKTVQASFNSMYLGGSKNLLTLMKYRFPELGLEKKDCSEMSWVQSTIYFAEYPIDSPLEILLNKTQEKRFYKAKSDYVKKPIPKTGLEGMMRRLLEKEEPQVILSPYGGKMSEISETELPFPHRKGNLFKIQYLAYWERLEETKEQIKWIRELYSYMTPYVSKSPRTAFLNYRDIDLGESKNGTASYSEARVWGKKYFKNNYDRLVRVKSKVDPENFYRNEQSIPVVRVN